MIDLKTSLFILLILLALGCASKETTREQPSFDGVCGYLTEQEVSDALGVSLTETPKSINESYLGGPGCSYAGSNEGAEAHFTYVIFTSSEEFEKAKTGEATTGAGDEAYIVNGPDAQQLWVKEDNHYVMVAIGDAPRPEGSKKLVSLVLERLKSNPLNK